MYLIFNPGTKRVRQKKYRVVLYQAKQKGITCHYTGESFLAYNVVEKEIIGVERIETPNIKWVNNIPEFFTLIENPPELKKTGTILTSYEIAKFKEKYNPEQI